MQRQNPAKLLKFRSQAQGLRSRNLRQSILKLLLLSSWLGLSFTLIALLLITIVEGSTYSRRYERPEYLEPARVAIVFGTGVRPDGRLSPMLADRVDGAVELYRLGRVQRLLMTGDNSRTDYDEVCETQNSCVWK